MKLLRSIGAILAGYLIFAISAQLLFFLTAHDPREPASIAYMALTSIYGACFAALGGFVTSRIAGRHALMHAAMLACLLALIALISLLAELGENSLWTQIAALVFMAPAVLVGAMIRLKSN